MKRQLTIIICTALLFALNDCEQTDEKEQYEEAARKLESIINSTHKDSGSTKRERWQEISDTDSIVLGVESIDTAESHLIENETYYFDDANCIVNGIEVKVDSITLQRVPKPEGYEISVCYSVENQNDSEVNFEFSSLDGNCFEFDGAKATLVAQVPLSDIKRTQFSMSPHEKREEKIGVFFAGSELYEIGIGGVNYGPIDLSALYEGQDISIDLLIKGYTVESSENIIMNFKLRL